MYSNITTPPPPPKKKIRIAVYTQDTPIIFNKPKCKTNKEYIYVGIFYVKIFM